MPLAITGIGKALILNRTEEEWRTLFKTCGDETKLGAFIQNMRRYAASGFAFDLEENEPIYPLRCSAGLQRRDEIVAAICRQYHHVYVAGASGRTGTLRQILCRRDIR